MDNTYLLLALAANPVGTAAMLLFMVVLFVILTLVPDAYRSYVCVVALFIPLVFLVPVAIKGRMASSVVKDMALISLVLAILSIFTAALFQKTRRAGRKSGHSRSFDLIVVGGGISALHTTYRLLKDHPDMNILILEKNSMLGGRIKREMMEGGLPVDMGAVRVPETFDTTLSLIEELDLPVTPFDPAFQGGWSKGRWYSKETWAQSSKAYLLNHDDLKPDQLVFTTLMDMIGEEGFKDPSKIDPNMMIEGQRLVDYSINSLLALKLTRQQIDWVSNFWGFGWYKSDVNAYSWLVHNLTAPEETNDPMNYSTKYFMIGPGFGNMYKLIEALDEKTQAASKILNFTVKSAKRQKGLWCVEGRHEEGEHEAFYGSKLLIATPTGAMTMIDVELPKGAAHQALWKHITQESTTPYILRRIYLRYPRKWWKAQGTSAVYDDETNQMVWILSNDSPVIMASYADQERASYSEGMTEEQIIDTYHRGLCRAFGVKDCNKVPKPLEYFVKRWSYPEYAVWWTKVGVNQKELLHVSSQPYQGYPLFLASDALSTKSGWIDGALESSNLVVSKIKDWNQDKE